MRGAGGKGRQGRVIALGIGVMAVGVAAAALLAAASSARAQGSNGRGGTQFSAYIDDLPIMPGLAEDEEGYAFDLFQGGRLAEARLVGEADPSAVRGFYAATLSQMGWKPSETEPYVYTRGREKLIFQLEPRRTRSGRPARGLDAVFVVKPDSVVAAAR